MPKGNSYRALMTERRDTTDMLALFAGFRVGMQGGEHQDRAAVLVCVSLLEQALEDAIWAQTADQAEDEKDRFFAEGGVATSLADKIFLAFVLGVIGPGIRHYLKVAGQNLSYNAAQKTYLRTANFSPTFMRDASERYLLQAAAVKNEWMLKESTWFEQMPTIEYVTLRTKRTPSAILLKVLDAIRDLQQIELRYSSLTGSSFQVRTIAPHSLFFSAGKWYARSWSQEHNDFRDYNLNRIASIESPAPCSVDRSLDYEWTQRINLEIVPNPKLPLPQRAAIAAEYDMQAEKLPIPCRLSMSFYLMSEYNLDVEEGKLKPEKQQLILVNLPDVLNARQTARKLSKEALARGPS